MEKVSRKQRLEKILQTVQAVAGADFSARLEPSGDDDLTPIEAAINRMADLVEAMTGEDAEKIGERTAKKPEQERTLNGLLAGKQLSDGIIGTAQTIIIVLDENADIRLFNDFTEKLTGYGREEVLGRNWIDLFIPGGDKKHIKKLFREIFRGDNLHWGNENPVRCKDGSLRLISWRNSLLKDEPGGPVSVLSIGLDITESRESKKGSRESEARLHALLSAMPDLMFRIRKDGTFLDYKAARFDDLAVPPEVFLGRKIQEILPEHVVSATMKHIERALKTGVMQIYEYELSVITGETMDFESRLVVSGTDEVLAIIRNITERKKAEERTKASLKEKDLLLNEIHHRVKNNLQVISSLLNLQAASVENETTREMFRESRNRVRTMALTHEQLYRSEDFSRIDFSEHLKNVAASLFRSYGIDPDIVTLEITVKDVFMEIDKAIPCGLIVHELVSNCLKHAFPEGRRGKISIRLQPESSGEIALLVSDDGVGLPDGIDICDTETLGLQLVNTLTDQLGGAVQVDCSDGTLFRIIISE